MKFGTLFSGGELAGVGIQAAGLTHAWGYELNDDIASVARSNGFNVTTADILAMDPRACQPVDALHASPPCPNFSVAKSGGEETALDIALGRKVAEFITVCKPNIVTIENVWGYRLSRSFAAITDALEAGGYWWAYTHENAADYGVPQSRRRLILRAVQGRFLPPLPEPVEWVGWYDAIEDLLPGLPASQFAPWQLARLPEELKQSTLVERHGAFNLQERGPQTRGPDEPIWTLRASDRQVEMATAFIMPTVNADGSARERYNEEPAFTVQATAKKNMPRAFIVSNAKTEWGDGIREAAEPVAAVTGESRGRVKAFIVQGTSTLDIRDACQPSATVMATVQAKAAMPRAFLAAPNSNADSRGGNAGFTTVTVRDELDPMFTVDASANKVTTRAWLSAGRVVSMTPRALARFQSVPDWYELPDKPSLACKIIGNGVACKMIEAIYKGLIA